MIYLSFLVKRTDSTADAAAGKMDIDRGGIQGSMSKQGLNGKQVRAILIKVCAKGMPERVAGETVRPSEFGFFGGDKLVGRIGSHGTGGIVTVGEKEPGRPAVFKPVTRQDIKGVFGEDGKAGRAVFGGTDMYVHGRAADVLITQAADFTDPEPRGIHEGNNGLMFKIGKRINKKEHFLLRRDIGKVFIKPAHGKLGVIPGPVEDIEGKETQLGNGAVDGPVREVSGMLQPADEATQIIP